MSKAPKTDDLIALICKAATEKYREDRVKPGIQIAHIPGEVSHVFQIAKDTLGAAVVLGIDMSSPETTPAFFYVALHRYPNPANGDLYHRDANGRALPPACPEVRVVAYKAQHEDLDRAVQLLAMQLLPVEAQAELAEAIRGLK
jgi:hypothetical protein